MNKRRYLHYAYMWLIQETATLDNSIKLCEDEDIKKLLINRRAQLIDDLAEISNRLE